MIRSFQRKITLLVLGFLLVILAGVVFAINYVNWKDLTDQAQYSLEVIVKNNGRRPGMGFRPEDDVPPPWLQEQQNPEDIGEAAYGSDENETAEADEDDSTEAEEADDKEDLDYGNNYEDFLDDIDVEDGPPLPPGMEREADREFAANLSTFYTVRLDDTGSILSWTSDRRELYTDEQVAASVKNALAAKKDFGRIDSQFFRLNSQENGSLLVVLDARMEISRAHSLLKTTTLTALLAYLILGLTAALLIRRMTRPVQDAFDKQKQFVWDASHELKTPLAVISANAEVLAGEIGENEWLQYIQSEVKRTDHLVQNLLTLARMDKGTVEPVFRPFDLSQAVLQVALPFESTVFEAGKTLDLEIPDGVTVKGDEDMIQQLVVILLSNAVKYSDDHGSIRVELDPRGPVLRVHNTGPAIDPEALPHVFDRFFRGDAAHNRETPGNGLGLAIAKNIVEAHKGTITAESSPEKGTTFTVTFS